MDDPIGKVLGFLAPRAAARRLSAQIALKNLRSYDGAARGRRTDGWRATATAADAEIAGAGSLLRDRMRDLVRNNPVAANAVSVLVSNFVGAGIRPRANTGDADLDQRINALWEAWAANCDARGRTDFYGLTALAVREMIEGGDVFALRRIRPDKSARAGRGVPLKIELREADHLDASLAKSASDGVQIDGGIEYSALGERAAYWMFNQHPGGTNRLVARSSVRIPATHVAHLYEQQRVQSRGVPWGVPAMRAMRDVDDWQVAELTRKKTEACLVGIVFGDEEDQMSIAPAPSDSSVEDGRGFQLEDVAGEKVEQFEPGMIAYARGGKDIKFNTPASTGGVYEWHRVQLHIIAAGWRMPYALLTGDLSQTSFSSSRVGLNEFRRMVEQMQWQTIIPAFCQPIWEWFCEAAHLAGHITDPDVPVEWDPPAFQSVNPLQDVQADLFEVRAGFSSLPQMIAKRGYDPRAVVSEHADFLKLTDDLGLVLDSDPRRVTKAGLAQTTDPATPPGNS